MSPETSEQALTLARLLRHQSLLKHRSGVLNGKRVDFFKAKYIFRFFETSFYVKKAKKTPSLPSIKTEEDVVKTIRLLVDHALIQRVDKLSSRKDRRGVRSYRLQTYASQEEITQDAYYAWLYDFVPMSTFFLGLGTLILILIIIVYPLWPSKMRRIVYYLSWAALGLISLLIVITILRLIFYVITTTFLPPGIWIFPNLYEDVGFVDSFKPIWDWHREKHKKIRKKE
ncbi:hypothetical protein PNEG_02906 [Pneumocystis murina B123]|uniref:Translocation protein SEC62 n=1 Tax=Pneumocystis murina (strain B123) TaxID=1069680 RepID=M7NNN3_PNEMU|nr:hypothetical protein PNEG_02906 [Pneumocystis murina B123]EMR08731.1 hypothetical protein PNEG_02906 [Pneumocystis murina B123]